MSSFTIFTLLLLSVFSIQSESVGNSILPKTDGSPVIDCSGTCNCNWLGNANCCTDETCCVAGSGTIVLACNNVPLNKLPAIGPLDLISALSCADVSSGQAQCTGDDTCQLIQVAPSVLGGDSKDANLAQQACCSAVAGSGTVCSQQSLCIQNDSNKFSCCPTSCSGTGRFWERK